MRHTFLTLAAKSGVHPSVMQELVGYSTARITMEAYTHANIDDKRAAMDALQAAFVQAVSAPKARESVKDGRAPKDEAREEAVDEPGREHRAGFETDSRMDNSRCSAS